MICIHIYVCVCVCVCVCVYIYIICIYMYKVVKEVAVETIVYVDKYMEVLILSKLALIEP